MTENPIISIIVITYNSEEFILETLESINAQTYQNIELIISDDASTDTTIKICEDWLNQYKNRFINYSILKSRVNTGLAANFNRGVKASNGIWLKPLAGDDILLKGCLEHIMIRIKEKELNVFAYATPSLPFLVENGKKVLMNDQVRKRPYFFREINSANDQYQLALRNTEQPSIPGFMVRKDVYENIGGCDERFSMLEDRPLILRVLKNNYRIDGDDRPTVLYRIHDKSVYRSNRLTELVNTWTIKYYIPVRKEYFLPNLSFPVAIAYRWVFFVRTIFYKTRLNKNTKFNKYLMKLLINPVNFFIWAVHRLWFKHYKRRVHHQMKFM